MKKIAALTVILFISSLHHIYAHALWIETSSTGKIGQAQQVKLFYGEYASNERDNISKWYSDVKDCTLWLIGPDQQKTQLETKLDSNFALASFKPSLPGIYTLLVNHTSKALAGTTMYGFLASTIVKVGSISGNVNPAFNTNELKVLAESADNRFIVNKPVKLTAILENITKSAKSISVFSPSGWSKEVITNAGGNAEFIPLCPGRYVVEITDYKKTTGEHQGKNYEAVWKGATCSFEVSNK